MALFIRFLPYIGFHNKTICITLYFITTETSTTMYATINTLYYNILHIHEQYQLESVMPSF